MNYTENNVLEFVEEIDEITDIRIKESINKAHKVFRFKFRKPMSENEQDSWMEVCYAYFTDGGDAYDEVLFDWRDDSEVEVEVK